MKRIPKTLRENAALLCAIAASSTSDGLTNAEFFMGFGPNDGVFDLALMAWRVAERAHPHDGYGVIAAEAEAMLRTGWTP